MAAVSMGWLSSGAHVEVAGYINSIATLDFKRANFDLFRDLLERIPCVKL